MEIFRAMLFKFCGEEAVSEGLTFSREGGGESATRELVL
jgi:hypothetical protein